MRKIGIVGGTAWQSTAGYYACICREAEARFGRTPEFAIESLELQRAVSLFGGDDERSWEGFDEYHRDALVRLARSGCEVLCFAANTPHHRFDAITAGVDAEVVHIVDAVAEEALSADVRDLLLLGTRVTMTSEPMRRRYEEHGVHVVVPPVDEHPAVVALIGRLQRGPAPAAETEIARLAGPWAAILGCTELALAFPDDAETKVIERGRDTYFNSMAIHASAVLKVATMTGS